jgi:hypothetical protein
MWCVSFPVLLSAALLLIFDRSFGYIWHLYCWWRFTLQGGSQFCSNLFWFYYLWGYILFCHWVLLQVIATNSLANQSLDIEWLCVMHFFIDNRLGSPHVYLRNESIS